MCSASGESHMLHQTWPKAKEITWQEQEVQKTKEPHGVYKNLLLETTRLSWELPQSLMRAALTWSTCTSQQYSRDQASTGLSRDKSHLSHRKHFSIPLSKILLRLLLGLEGNANSFPWSWRLVLFSTISSHFWNWSDQGFFGFSNILPSFSWLPFNLFHNTQ